MPDPRCYRFIRATSRAASEGVTPPSSLLRAHAPDHLPLRASRLLALARRVFAGCRQSLLGSGPSRHYLCDPCVGAWTRTPPRSSGALARFFPEVFGLTPAVTGSARESIPALQLRLGGLFRGCSHSFIFRLPHLLGPLVAPTRDLSQAAGPFTPRIAQVVAHSRMWHRYVPDPGN